MEYKGIAYLRNKLATKQSRVLTRYAFYEMKYTAKDFDISTPPKLRGYKSTLGWCQKAVDSLADRLRFKRFDNDVLNFNGIFQNNNPDVFFDSAIHESLIGSCSFVYISQDTRGQIPKLQVISGAEATGIMNPFNGFLEEGYAILEKDEHNKVSKELYFTGEYTDLYEYGSFAERYDNPTGIPLLVPIPYKPDAVRPFGHSRISRACMSYETSASRTLKRSEISAEFYSFPQKYVLGLGEDAEPMEKWKASMSAMLSFTKDEDGDRPVVGQFAQQSMSPHIEQIKMFASLFAGETGLTTEDLGFVNSNPTSAESIKASHETLNLIAKKAQRCFASSFLNVGLVASSLRDGQHYERSALKDVKAVWMPIFEADASMLSAIGDGVIKFGQVMPDFITKETVEQLTGIESK